MWIGILYKPPHLLNFTAMKKGYYWIKPIDNTLNGLQHYQASVIGDIEFKVDKGRVAFKLNHYFPVGSVFHFMHTKCNYVITKRLIRRGLWYEARREDGCKLEPGDIERFTSGRYIYRNGFMHVKCCE